MKFSPDQLKAKGYMQDIGTGQWRKKVLPIGVVPVPTVAVVQPPLIAAPMGISTDEAKLNKLEKAFLAWLRGTPCGWIGIQCITLKLGDDCRYTPDFWTAAFSGSLHAHEVKGFMRDDARVKLKVAARMYPMIQFTLVQRIKGIWKFTDIKP